MQILNFRIPFSRRFKFQRPWQKTYKVRLLSWSVRNARDRWGIWIVNVQLHHSSAKLASTEQVQFRQPIQKIATTTLLSIESLKRRSNCEPTPVIPASHATIIHSTFNVRPQPFQTFSQCFVLQTRGTCSFASIWLWKLDLCVLNGWHHYLFLDYTQCSHSTFQNNLKVICYSNQSYMFYLDDVITWWRH